MTIEEFKSAWEARSTEKPARNRPEVGEWEEIAMGEYTLLKYCKCYWDAESSAVVKVAKPVVKSKGKEKRHLVPMFDRYFVWKKNGVRGLYNCNRYKGAPRDYEGRPGTLLYDVGDLSLKQIEALIEDGGYTNWERYDSRAPKTYIYREREVLTGRDISREYDGRSIVALMTERPKGSYNYFLNTILHEGGSIDEDGIIHAPQGK